MDLSVVVVNPDFDDEGLDQIAGRLRLELAGSAAGVDVWDLPAATGGATVGGLIVTVTDGADSLRQVLSVVSDWRQRHQGSAVRLALGDDEIELSDATMAAQDRLLDAFLARHEAD